MAEDDDRTRLLRFVERFALVLREAGMAPMAARVLAYALADDADRYTAGRPGRRAAGQPRGDQRGGAPAACSSGCFVREREPGTRSDLYVLDDRDLWSRVVGTEMAMLSRFEDTVAAGIEAIGLDRPGGRRLAETQEFFAFLREELAGISPDGRRSADRRLATLRPTGA